MSERDKARSGQERGAAGMMASPLFFLSSPFYRHLVFPLPASLPIIKSLCGHLPVSSSRGLIIKQPESSVILTSSRLPARAFAFYFLHHLETKRTYASVGANPDKWQGDRYLRHTGDTHTQGSVKLLPADEQPEVAVQLRVRVSCGNPSFFCSKKQKEVGRKKRRGGVE